MSESGLPGTGKLIRWEGRLGVFRPVTETEPGTEEELQRLVEVLKAELERVQKENEDLEAQLADLRRTARSPEDTAAAIANATDELQRQLTEASNGVTRFALRELALDLAVFVDVNELGVLQYRFPRPDEAPTGGTLSRLTLNVAPIPAEAEPADPALLERVVPISEIVGLDAEQQAALVRRGVTTAESFAAAVTRVRASAELEALLGVDRQQLVSWRAEAELVALRAVDGRSAFVLVAAGITGIEALAEQEPSALAERFNAAAAQLGIGPVPELTESVAATWVQAAANVQQGRSRL